MVVVVIKETTTTVPFLVVFPYPSFFSLSLARSSASHLLVVFSSPVWTCISFPPPLTKPHPPPHCTQYLYHFRV